ncbi:hypothetical protein IW139_000896 [Coemansia sp. RSA 353]|nr:hypothetical protein GGH18_000324 [Coemansia sp. RSA 530]KAJ2209000.1 hypothetical protein IW145_000266 [Coemansia sp. RSA 521]KAJ2300748.1 hypothetical protein IW139_000896 [Coemansia sp. RSA 353]
MIYISDSEDIQQSQDKLQVSWAQCVSADIASSVVSLGSDSQIQLNSSGWPSQLNMSQLNMSQPNSSGWPSLLNIASNVSLLSSYTPEASEDVDALIQICQADCDHELPESVFGKPREQRSQAGPMDIDAGDSSWLQSPTEQSRKRRFVGTQKEKAQDTHPPVLSTAPFVFSMPVPQVNDDEPMDWEMTQPALRSDNQPISPHAALRIAARRRNDSVASDAQAFANIEDSPMVSDQRFNRRRQRRQQRQQRQQSRQRQQRAEDASSAWTTASESEGESDRHSDVLGEVYRSRASGNRGQRSARSRREWRVSQGVDRVLALMGNRVEAPSTTERLQMHRDIPYVLSGYLQLAFNVFMVGTVLVLVMHVLVTIQHDVNAKVHEHSAEILHEISACSKQYLDNRCDPLMRVPAMEQACAAWEACMHRDPSKVSRSRVSAETLAEIVNGFIEPISLKTMLFFVCMFFGTLFVSNFAFGAYRHSRVHQQYVSQSGDATFASPDRGPMSSARRGRRNDDPMASPSPHSASAQMLVTSGRARRRYQHRSPGTSLTRRDRSAHSSDHTRTPFR